MKDESIQEKLIRQIIKQGKGELVFPSDFVALGSSDAIRQGLSRLAKDKTLVRLGQGIYLYPEYDPKLGMFLPSTDEIARRIAKRDRARIIPTGTTALNKLGLSTQVPMKVVYLTDGAPRKVKVGNRTITFKTTAPKVLEMRGKISSLVIQALRELGKEQINEDLINRIKAILKDEKPENITYDAKLAPEWISKILNRIIKEWNG